MPTLYRKRAFGALLPLSIGASVLLGAGWTLQAAARQSVLPTSKPNPKSKIQNPKSPSTSEPAQERSNFTGKNWKHDERTGTGTIEDFSWRPDPNGDNADASVTGDSGRYDTKKKLFFAEGRLVFDDAKHHVTGDKADISYGKSKKLAIITGHVIIVLKPDKPAHGEAAPAVVPAVATSKGEVGVAPVTPPAASQKTDDSGNDLSKERGHGVTITCDRVDDYYGKKFVIMRGNLVFKQHLVKGNGHAVDRTMTAEHAEYDGNAEKMHLFAPVKAHDSDGESLTFDKDVIVGTKEGEETLETTGQVNGKDILNPDEEGGDSTDNTSIAAEKTSPAPPEKTPPVAPSPGTPPKK